MKRRTIECFQTLRLAKKTSKDDYFTHMRLVLLAIGVVGTLGFVIQMIGELVFP